MAQEVREPQQQTLEEPRDQPPQQAAESPAGPSLSQSLSFSRLNARAPEFVPRTPSPAAAGGHGGGRAREHHHHPGHRQPHHHHQPVMHVVYHQPAAAAAAAPVAPHFVVPATGHGMHHHPEFFGGGAGEHEGDPDQAPAPSAVREGLSEEVVQKIVKQVEYYFSDANLATTEHLMRFITKDPEGFVPMHAITTFKKIKALVHNNFLLADALRTSSKLEVSDDGKKVRRRQPFTESDVILLQSRIVVAENLPDDHCYQSLMKIFSVVGSVKAIRTCYPQVSNGTSSATNRSSKMDMLFANKLHAFVEYETVEDAEKAVAELNDGRNWRSGLTVRLLSSCMVQSKQGAGKGKKMGNEADGNVEEENVSQTDQPNTKQMEQSPTQSSEAPNEFLGEEVHDRESGPARRGRGRGRGGCRGRGRGHLNTSNINQNHHRGSGGHAIGTPPSGHQVHGEPTSAPKPPPGPRMPDGTRGFTMGRGKPLSPPPAVGVCP